MRPKILVRFADCPDRMTLVAEFAARWSKVVSAAVEAAEEGPLPEIFVPHRVHNTSAVKDVIEFGLSKSRLRTWADVVAWWKDRPVFRFLEVDIPEIELYLLVDLALKKETIGKSLENYCEPKEYVAHTADWSRLLDADHADNSPLEFDDATGNLLVAFNTNWVRNLRTFVDTKSTQIMTGFIFPCSWSFSYPMVSLGLILRTRRDCDADMLPLLEWYFKIWHRAHTIAKPISLTAMLSFHRPSEFTRCDDLDIDLPRKSE